SDEDVERVEAEANSAKEAGIDGVPCFIFGGLLAVNGAQSPEYLAQAIERASAELARRGGAGEPHHLSNRARTRSALAAIHDPTMRTPNCCHLRVARAAPALTTTSSTQAPSPVPRSIAFPCAIVAACGGESSASAAPAMAASSQPTGLGGAHADATRPPMSAASAS